MKKKKYLWSVMTILMAFLSVSLMSCSGDDDNEGSTQEEKKDGKTQYKEAVDLGLSVKWASCNVGATKPEEFGDYFAWGETESKSDYSWETYKYSNGGAKDLTKYCPRKDLGHDGFTDNKYELESSDDVATVKWGGSWRMPTYREFNELSDSCTWIATTLNGVQGMKVVGKNGNSIFLPITGTMNGTSIRSSDNNWGHYWSKSISRDIYFDNADCGLCMGIRWDNEGSGYQSNGYLYSRYLGLTIRPVCTK